MLTEQEFENCKNASAMAFNNTASGLTKGLQISSNTGNASFLSEDYRKISTCKKSSGFGAESYINNNKKEIILAIGGACGPADYGNMAGLAFGFLTRQYNDALNYYTDVKNKYPNYEIVVTGSSLGGTLAQALGATTGCKAVTINSWGIKDLMPKIGMNPNSKYPNIKNYRTSNDLLYLLQNSLSDKCIGQTYIIPSNYKNPIQSHQNIDILDINNAIASEKWEKEHGKISLIGYYKEKYKNDFATPIKYDIKDPFIQGFDGEKKNDRNPSQKTADEINNDKWNSNDISFLEGFHSKDKDNHLIKEAKNKRKEKAKSKGNEGKGPNGEDGYWYTTKTGKHVFVPDD